MITRTSQPASGAMLISEMKEFASFPKATQRYIRRSLDVAYGRRDPIECWARDEGEAASIRAQARLYKQLDHLRAIKRREMLHIGVRDLLRLSSVEETLTALSVLAEALISAAYWVCASALRRRAWS